MYAEAIATANADINRCATGGQTGIHMLAELLNVCEPVLDASCGVEKPYAIAEINESRCTGCTLCLQTCPVDAIVGTGKMMHTVISSCCTGCERCLERCPMDCIEMKPVSGEKTGWDAWSFRQAQQARERYERRSFPVTTGKGKRIGPTFCPDRQIPEIRHSQENNGTCQSPFKNTRYNGMTIVRTRTVHHIQTYRRHNI